MKIVIYTLFDIVVVVVVVDTAVAIVGIAAA